MKQNLSDLHAGLCPKIVEFCKLSASLGYDWGWVDTCCINKESSAELSEAINSMFEWYSKSAVCIAYLADVDHFHYMHDLSRFTLGRHPELQQFAASRWFTRGWTLQELIAPSTVLFVSKSWSILGTKALLARPISSITDIDTDVLITPSTYSKASVFRRFFWARNRQTTRVEDRAYSLLGLFNVNMPTIYGEGENAFRRLQEEILRVSPDQTMFMWGMGDHPWSAGLFAPSPSAFQAFSISSRASPVCPEPIALEDMPIAISSFTSALQRMKGCGPSSLVVSSATSLTAGRFHDLITRKQAPQPNIHDLPVYTLTSFGVIAKFPVILIVPNSEELAREPLSIAILSCQHDGYFVGLLLHLRHHTSVPQYGVGAASWWQGVQSSSLPQAKSEGYPRLIFAAIPSEGRKPAISYSSSVPSSAANAVIHEGELAGGEWSSVCINHDRGGHPFWRQQSSVESSWQPLPDVPRWVSGKLQRAGFTLSSPSSTKFSARTSHGSANLQPTKSSRVEYTSDSESNSVNEYSAIHEYAAALELPIIYEYSEVYRWRRLSSHRDFEVHTRMISTQYPEADREVFIRVVFYGKGETKKGEDELSCEGSLTSYVFEDADGTREVRVTVTAEGTGFELRRTMDIDVGGSAYGLPPLH